MKQNSLIDTVDEIKDRILKGRYKPSERLVETELAKDIGVGRHVIRMALTRLEADGLVNIAPNRGATVANLSIEEAIDILYARQALEGAAASLAAERISDEQLDKLEELIGRMKAALDEKKFDLYSEINVEFHGIIYDACGSKKIPDIISSLRARVVRLQFRTILLPGRNEQSFNEHKGIYEALRKRSPEEAEAAMKKHFESLRRALNDPYFSYMT